MTGIVATVDAAEIVSVVLLGLIAVFAGGEIVGATLRRVDPVESKGAGRSSIRNAGRYIGWLERGLVYTVIVAGMPGGVAVVMAVKTAARFPQFEKEERFVEYYLIGTLASLAIALAAALGARAVLGLSPFD